MKKVVEVNLSTLGFQFTKQRLHSGAVQKTNFRPTSIFWEIQEFKSAE